MDRQLQEHMLQPRLLTQSFLDELRAVFPFLVFWTPSDSCIDSAYFRLSNRLFEHGLTYIWQSNCIGNMQGIVEIYASNGTSNFQKLTIPEQKHIHLEDYIPPMTEFLLYKVVICNGTPQKKQVEYHLGGMKGVKYPITPPETDQEVAEMMARLSGYTIT